MNVQHKFEPYCDKCPDLEAMATTEKQYARELMVRQTVTVTCAHAARCKAIYRYLQATNPPTLAEETLQRTLDQIYSTHDCNECGRLCCEYKPKPGEFTRWNCPLFIPMEGTKHGTR